MKTITESILFMVLSILTALYCLLVAVFSACSLNWWCVAINILLVCANVWLARKCYKRAKRIEESMEARIRMIYDILPIDEIIVYSNMHKVINQMNPKVKEDEVEADK